MTPWTHLVRFTAAEDGEAYYSKCDSTLPLVGEKVASFKSITVLDSDNLKSDLKTIQEASFPELQGFIAKVHLDTSSGGSRPPHRLHRVELL